jgi:hypothetical protein
MIKIFSPHIDDAAISLGGAIIKFIEALKYINYTESGVEIYDVYTGSSYINPDNLLIDRQQIDGIRLRMQEEILASAEYGFKAIFFDEVIAQKNNLNIPDLVKHFILSNIQENDEVYFPLNLGRGHRDHLFLKDIGLNLRKERKVNFYEDITYLPKQNYDDAYYALSKNLIPKKIKIDSKKKEEFLRCYPSQMNEGLIQQILTYHEGFEVVWSSQ